MTEEIKALLIKLAELKEMTKIDDRTYKGKYGQIFIMTSFGFISEVQYNKTHRYNDQI
jgi:hypothetical protein